MKKPIAQEPLAAGPVLIRRKQYRKLLGLLDRNASTTVIVKGAPGDEEITVSMGPPIPAAKE